MERPSLGAAFRFSGLCAQPRPGGAPGVEVFDQQRLAVDTSRHRLNGDPIEVIEGRYDGAGRETQAHGARQPVAREPFLLASMNQDEAADVAEQALPRGEACAVRGGTELGVVLRIEEPEED